MIERCKNSKCKERSMMQYLDRPMVFGGEENTDICHEKITKHVKLTNLQSKN